jgi:putative spermidine/putrescine transport system permease protein
MRITFDVQNGIVRTRKSTRDFITFDVMGGEQIASAGKVVEARLNALQFPPAAANAVILLAVTLLIIIGLNRIVDVRKEL